MNIVTFSYGFPALAVVVRHHLRPRRVFADVLRKPYNDRVCCNGAEFFVRFFSNLGRR